MKLLPFIATLFLTLSSCQPSTERPPNETVLADTVGFAGFGFELLLAKIEQLEAKLQEQNSIQQQLDATSKLISTLQRRLDETQSTLQARDALVGNLQQKLSQSESQFRQAQDNLAKQVTQNVQLNRNVYILSGYPSCRDAPDQTGPQKLRVGSQTVQGYCEQDDYGGGWLVIQRRSSGGLGAESFNRSWADYRNGFGSLDGDHWWGLEKVHLLTKGHVHELLVEVTDGFWGIQWAKWNRFQLGSEMKRYEIVLLEGCSGNGTCYGLEKGEPFNTFDRSSSESCEEMVREGGWWLKSFCRSNLNAIIRSSNQESNMIWHHSQKLSSRIMIRMKIDNL
uniref:Angiopoietin-related protein 6 n=4 Tax=Culex pipiens TaxID=7175 RepID=A0A8D8C852_CULPI